MLSPNLMVNFRNALNTHAPKKKLNPSNVLVHLFYLLSLNFRITCTLFFAFVFLSLCLSLSLLYDANVICLCRPNSDCTYYPCCLVQMKFPYFHNTIVKHQPTTIKSPKKNFTIKSEQTETIDTKRQKIFIEIKTNYLFYFF